MGRKKKEPPAIIMYKGMWGINSSQKPKWWNSIWEITKLDEKILIAETKETYHFEGVLTAYGELKYNYKYVVICCYNILTMYLVPMYDSLFKDYQTRVQDFYGFDEYNFKLRKLDLQVGDLLEIFRCPVMRTSVKYDFPIIKEDDISEEMGVLLTQVGVALPTVDKMKEFDLDREQPDQAIKGKDIILGLLFGIDKFVE